MNCNTSVWPSKSLHCGKRDPIRPRKRALMNGERALPFGPNRTKAYSFAAYRATPSHGSRCACSRSFARISGPDRTIFAFLLLSASLFARPLQTSCKSHDFEMRTHFVVYPFSSRISQHDRVQRRIIIIIIKYNYLKNIFVCFQGSHSHQ